MMVSTCADASVTENWKNPGDEFVTPTATEAAVAVYGRLLICAVTCAAPPLGDGLVVLDSQLATLKQRQRRIPTGINSRMPGMLSRFKTHGFLTSASTVA